MKRFHRLMAGWLLAGLFAGCSGAGGLDQTGAPPAAAAPPSAPTATTRGTLMADKFSAYPRMVLQSRHANAALNGRIVASMSSSDDGGANVAAIYASNDQGRHFDRIGTVADPDFKTGQCCGTLYELPVPIGALPAGTLLYAASVGQERNGAPMENRIYSSTDGGVHWTYLSLCGTGRIPKNATQPSGIWEPEFAIAKSGELVCYYSDETLAGHSQVLVEITSRDAVHWSEPRLVVASDDPNGRPGMAGVRRVADGMYLMSYENCYAGPLDCSVRIKRSADGLDWGSPKDFGTRLETADGRFLRHAPTLAWTPQAGQPGGVLVVVGQILFDKNGTPDAAGNGKVLFTNTTPDGSGPWHAVTAPLAIPHPPTVTNWCQNYSSALLPSADGGTLTMLQSDGGADHSCRMYYGSAPLLP